MSFKLRNGKTKSIEKIICNCGTEKLAPVLLNDDIYVIKDKLITIVTFCNICKKVVNYKLTERIFTENCRKDFYAINKTGKFDNLNNYLNDFVNNVVKSIFSINNMVVDFIVYKNLYELDIFKEFNVVFYELFLLNFKNESFCFDINEFQDYYTKIINSYKSTNNPMYVKLLDSVKTKLNILSLKLENLKEKIAKEECEKDIIDILCIFTF